MVVPVPTCCEVLLPPSAGHAISTEGGSMADITSFSFVGDWRVTVIGKNAGWSQRVSATDTAAGHVVLAGLPGQSRDVFGDRQAPWTLTIEHNDGSSGWQPNWLNVTRLAGPALEYRVASEDVTTPSSDRDFDDLVIRVEKLGMASQPVPPFAVRPETLQAMPEGVFEASLGRYFMAVRVTNIWTEPWPGRPASGSRTGAVHGSPPQASWSWTRGRRTSRPPWAKRWPGDGWRSARWHRGRRSSIYLKVDVSAAQARKHHVEIQVHTADGAEDIGLVNPKAKAPIQVSRTTYDPTEKAFVSACDVGSMTVAVKELVVDLSTLKRAMAEARRLSRALAPGHGTGSGGATTGGCDPRALDRVRHQLRQFLDGKDVDLCALWRELACCCAGGGPGGPSGGDDDWTEGGDPGLGFFAWPSVVDYAIDYRPPFAGQFGPIPFDDPWWKVLLVIIAIILSLAAGASSVADLANHSDDVVIGTLTRSILNAQSSEPAIQPLPDEPGSIDAAVVTLNGDRALTTAVFSTLDAESGEFYTTTPIVALDGRIDTPGTILTNAQINTIFQNLADNPADPAAQAAVRAYKTGARSGVALGVLSSLDPVAPRSDDGTTVYFLNQVVFTQDGDTTDALSCPGDSGSLWFQQGTNAVIALNHASPGTGLSATACRIEDVMTQLGIRFV